MRFVALAATTMAVMSLLTVGSATRAQADQAILAWSHHLTQLDPTSLISQLDGNVTVAQCNANPSSSALAVKDYHQSGSLVGAGREIPNNANPRPNICPHNGESVVDKTGSLYTVAQAPPQYRTQLAAYAGSVQKWIISTLPHSCQSLTKLTVGTNGNIYALLTRCGSWAQESYLFGVTPGVLPGNTAPSTVLDIQLSSTPVGHGLAAYGSGLIVQYVNGIQYYGYNGSTSDLQVVNNIGYTTQLSATLDGRVFLPIKAANTTGCPSPNGATAEKITAFEASGLQWTYSSLPACADVHDLRPNYHGGVVAHAVVNNGTINEQRFMNIDRNGQLLWTVPYLTPGTTFHPGWTTTLNGDIALQGLYRQNYHYGVKFMLLSGVTGETLFVNDFYSATDGYYPVNQSTDITITKNRAYLSLSKCPGGWPCGVEPTLYALNLPSLEMDYPRGAVLRYGEPRKNLVVGGDSYASGQGAKPYDVGTEASGPPGNECRQSSSAYGRLLGISPLSRFNITAFKACGGATTRDVVNGRIENGWARKPEQVSVISASTDIVMLTIGGNDIGFELFARACVETSCAGLAEQEAIRKAEEELPSNLSYMLGEIGSRLSANARVLVVGYPRMIEDPNYTAPYCGYLLPEEKFAIQRVISALNSQLIQGVARARTAFANKNIRFDYVDVNGSSSRFLGHGLCYEDSYFHGVVLDDVNSSFHPKANGHEAYRQEIEAWLIRNP